MKGVRRVAGIEGLQADGEGPAPWLRGGGNRRGCAALNMLSRWMEHAAIETTAIYASGLGDEQRSISERTWR